MTLLQLSSNASRSTMPWVFADNANDDEVSSSALLSHHGLDSDGAMCVDGGL